MNVDPYGIILITGALLLSLYATRISYCLYLDLKTQFFQYATYAYACVCLMVLGYYFPALFSAEDYEQFVTSGQLFMASFGLLALAFLVHAIEYVKKTPNESIINAAFILSGGLIASRFIPSQYLVEWTGIGWQQSYGSYVIGLSILEFFFLCIVLGPIVIEVARRIRKMAIYGSEGTILFAGFMAVLLFFGSFMIISVTFGIHILPFSANYYLFMILIAGFTGIIARLLTIYPTIFFASSYDIFEVLFVERTTHDIAYRYRFHSEDTISDLMGIPIAQSSIQQVFNDALEKPGSVKSIRVEDIEILVAEGDRYHGLLLTNRGSLLSYRLLLKSLQIFESSFAEKDIKDFERFSLEIENLFQFAIHRHQPKQEALMDGS